MVRKIVKKKKWNKRGQTIFLSLMIGVICFWLGLTLAHPMSQIVNDARNNGDTNLSCSTAVTYQEKANCVAVDTMLPLMIGTIFGIAGFFIGGRL
jgi:hypothetical protein